MDYMQISAFTLIAMLLVVSPGPNGLLIAKTVPSAGKKSGFFNVFGFVAAFYLHGILSILGISVLLSKSAEAFYIVKLLGAMYLCWLGVKSLIGAYKYKHQQPTDNNASNNQKISLTKSFIEGFITNALNPKVSMFYLAAFPQFIPANEQAVLFAFVLISIHSLINLLWFSSMIMLISRLSLKVKSESFQRILKSVTGFIFIGFGVKLLSLENK